VMAKIVVAIAPMAIFSGRLRAIVVVSGQSLKTTSALVGPLTTGSRGLVVS
jgi:hypothetical protein